jgi:hypothetical protein
MNRLPDRVFHMADVGNWASIEREGLFSAAALVRRAGLTGKAAAPFLDYRDGQRTLPGGETLRDQRPMPPSALERCLDPGLKPAGWYDMVNSMVFFWLDADRLGRHRHACASRAQIVMVIDARALADRHGARAFVTPFNSGNARRAAAPRGLRTFVPVTRWIKQGWVTEAAPGQAPRRPNHPPAELAIEGGVPDVMSMLIDTCRLGAGQAFAAGRYQSET